MEIKKGDVVLDTISGQSVVVYDEIKEGYIVTLNNGDMAQIAKEYIVPLQKEDDNINHPHRYTKGKIECIDAIESAVSDLNGFEGLCIGNVIKYCWRWKEKEQVASLKKARWYLNHLIAKLEESQ